jgi:antitoxin PrlF
MNASAKITSKGQITLPAELRKALNLKPGDRVDFRKTESGNYELIAKQLRFEDLRGMITLAGPPPSIDQIIADIEEAKRIRAAAIARKSGSDDNS